MDKNQRKAYMRTRLSQLKEIDVHNIKSSKKEELKWNY